MPVIRYANGTLRVPVETLAILELEDGQHLDESPNPLAKVIAAAFVQVNQEESAALQSAAFGASTTTKEHMP